MDELRALATRKKPEAEAPKLCDFIYNQSPEKANVWIQKEDEWLPGAGDRGWGVNREKLQMGTKVIFLRRWKCSKTK